MAIIGNLHSDVGIAKKVNQDAACVKIKITPYGEVALAVVCDGMGGLAHGEIASSVMVKAFVKWFESDFEKILKEKTFDEILSSWASIIQATNEDIYNYAYNRNFKMGTTLSVILICQNTFYIAHVGDTRIYEIGQNIELLTEDDTFINREIKAGRLSIEDTKNHPKSHVLTQCIGVKPSVAPLLIKRSYNPHKIYLLCSDGFRNKFSEKEILDRFSPSQLKDLGSIKLQQYLAIEDLKARLEKDNITVAVLAKNQKNSENHENFSVVSLQSSISF